MGHSSFPLGVELASLALLISHEDQGPLIKNLELTVDVWCGGETVGKSGHPETLGCWKSWNLKLGSWVTGALLLKGNQELGNEPFIRIRAMPTSEDGQGQSSINHHLVP
jgi:hypothetical protein